MTRPDTSPGTPVEAVHLDVDPHPRARTFELASFLALMAEIEQELRQQDQWELIPPSPKAFESRLPFCCDSMGFTQWLQWVFIPHTRALAEAGGPLPEVSGIRPMAEEVLRDCSWRTIPLMLLLDRFNRTINTSPVPRRR